MPRSNGAFDLDRILKAIHGGQCPLWNEVAYSLTTIVPRKYPLPYILP